MLVEVVASRSRDLLRFASNAAAASSLVSMLLGNRCTWLKKAKRSESRSYCMVKSDC